MGEPMRLTAVVPPPRSDHGSTPRNFDEVDSFVDALNTVAGITASVVEGTLADAPGDGLILMYNPAACSFDIPLELGPRIIEVNADRGQVRGEMEKYQLVAAIEDGNYSPWRTQPHTCSLLARQDVAERMGAVRVSDYYLTRHYAEYRHPEHPNLAVFLAHYILAFAQDGGKLQRSSGTRPAGREFLRELDAACWVPARLQPATLIVLDRVAPDTGATSFVRTMIDALAEIYGSEWSQPTPSGIRIEDGLAEAQARGRGGSTGFIDDLIAACTTNPLWGRNHSSLFMYDLMKYGLREALALLLDDHPELAALPAMRAYISMSALRISRAFVAHEHDVVARLARLPADSFLAALVCGQQPRWGTPAGESLRQIRGAITWRCDVPGPNPSLHTEAALLRALLHGEPHPDDAADLLCELADRNRTGQRNVDRNGSHYAFAAELYRAALRYRPDAPEIMARLNECVAASGAAVNPRG